MVSKSYKHRKDEPGDESFESRYERACETAGYEPLTEDQRIREVEQVGDLCRKKLLPTSCLCILISV